MQLKQEQPQETRPQQTPSAELAESESPAAPAFTDRDSVIALRLRKRLRRRNPVRRIADALLTNEDRSREDVEPLLAALENTSVFGWKARHVAAWALGQLDLTPEQKVQATEALLHVLEGRQRGRKRYLNALLRTLAFSFPLSGLFLFREILIYPLLPPVMTMTDGAAFLAYLTAFLAFFLVPISLVIDELLVTVLLPSRSAVCTCLKKWARC